MSEYRDEIVKAMSMLAEDGRVIFLGQSIKYPGHVMFNTLEDARVPVKKRVELPVFEDTQLGLSIGWTLEGFIPISIFPRMDFLIIACNQLVNHLDKIESMSQGQFKPKVIIRTMVGSTKPMNPGPQHCQDHSESLRLMLSNVDVVKLTKAEEIVPAYKQALESDRSSVLVEVADLYGF